MNALVISLRALRHPLTLLSIGVLLFNDHVLKATAPSWFTGKLSDIAGLFFFPYLLTALLALPLTRARVHPRRLMTFASAITLVCFVLIKTVPLVNLQTANAVGLALGRAVHIALDPTDLVALPMIGLAGWLWVRLEAQPILQRPGKSAYVTLGLAAIATMATSPCWPIPKVSRVMVVEQVYYLGLSYESGGTQVAQSTDGGISWDISPNPPKEIVEQLQQVVALPKVVCSAANPRQCYRITGEELVEASQDSGQSWQVAWRVPWGRRQFMDHVLYAGPIGSCKSGIDMGPYDLALSEGEGPPTLIVAMGNEGVLLRSPGGEWQRYGVLHAVPTPFTQTYPLGIIFDILPELLIILLGGLLTLLALSISVWWRVLAKAKVNSSPRRSVAWAVLPSIGILVFLALSGVIGRLSMIRFNPSETQSWMQGDRYFHALALSIVISVFIYRWLALAALAALVIGLVLTWRRVGQVAPQPNLIRKVSRDTLLTALGVCLAPGLSFALWALGVIPLYEVALAIALLSAGLILWQGVRRVGYYNRMAEPLLDAPVTKTGL